MRFTSGRTRDEPVRCGRAERTMRTQGSASRRIRSGIRVSSTSFWAEGVVDAAVGAGLAGTAGAGGVTTSTGVGGKPRIGRAHPTRAETRTMAEKPSGRANLVTFDDY